MIERNSFFASQEEDDILVAILTNQYDSKESSCEDPTCSLQTVLPKHNSPHFPIATNYLHILLPQEIKSPSIAKVLMMDKVRRTEIAIGKELNINKDLPASQMTSLI